MAGSKNMILIKGRKFIQDFKSLNSSSAEVLKSLKEAGYSGQIFYNWTHRMGEDGTSRVSKEVFDKLCEISGLSYDDYFISTTTYFKNPSKKKERQFYPPLHSKKKTAPKVHSTRLKNGITVTTYTKTSAETKNSSETTKSLEVYPNVGTFFLRLSSFRSHMQVYRRLLGITTTAMQDEYMFNNYTDVEEGKTVLSIASYFSLSKIFMDKYNSLPESAIKSAFADLAKEYNDIYVDIVYFGDTLKTMKSGR